MNKTLVAFFGFPAFAVAMFGAVDDLSASLCTLIFYIAWSCFVLLCGIRYAKNVKRNTRPRSVFPIAAVIAWIVVTVCSTATFSWMQYCGNAGRLIVMQRQYDDEVARLSEPRLAIWDRGGMLFSGIAVIYDDTDQIGLPQERQTEAWKNRIRNTELGCGESIPEFGFDAEHFWGHYYLDEVGC